MSDAGLSLVCRVQGRLCALPLEHVVETMRPQPVEHVAGAPRFVRGLALIRGAPTPVVDGASLVADAGIRGGRLVTLAVGSRCVALAVDSVLGVRAIPADSRCALPPLLSDAGADVVAAVGVLDAELLLVLHGARLLSDEDWTRLDLPGCAA